MKKAIVGLGVAVLITGILLVVLPFVFTTTITHSYIPDSAMIARDMFMVSESSNFTRTIYLNAEDLLGIHVGVSSIQKDQVIDFSVGDGSNTLLSFPRITTVNENWTVPSSKNYNFVIDGSHGSNAAIGEIWVYKRSEVAYRTDTVQSAYASTIASVGLVLTFVGVGVCIFGIVKKDSPKIPSIR